MTVVQHSQLLYSGLSTDVKPTVGVVTGSRFIETDHNIEAYLWDNFSWHPLFNVVSLEQNQRVHNGQMWIISALYEAVADDANADLIFTVKAPGMHMTFRVASQGAIFAHIYENPTVTGATGTTALVINARRETGDGGAPTAIAGQTVTNVGTEIMTWYAPGGSGGNAQGGALTHEIEIALEEAAVYLFRMTNKKGNAADMSWALNAYEED